MIYTYDSMGQLTGCTDNRSGSTVNYTYTYDTAGNIRSSTEGNTEKVYYYENTSWPDLLTEVSVSNTTETIIYPVSDGMVTAGTPLTWYNGNSYTFTWKKGTQLSTVVKDGITASYSYDMDGIRNSKTVGNTVYHFDTLSGKVMHQTGASRELWFIYDENGQPFMLIAKDGTEVREYWYLLNAVGDVIGILNSNQQIVTTYRYDPYGRIIDEWTDPLDDIGTLNPLRYRGYYYDSETGFYYLQSRYYDPEIGRFISADTFATTSSADFLSCNMFAYCLNDPVNRIDDGGDYSVGAAAFVAGFIVGGASQMISNVVSGDKLSAGVLGAAFGGGASASIMAVKAMFIPAGFIGAGIELIINIAEAYDNGALNFSLSNICSTLLETTVKGALYSVTGAISSLVIPMDPAVQAVDSLIAGPSQVLWKESVYQSVLTTPGYAISNMTISRNESTQRSAKATSRATIPITRRGMRSRSRPAVMVA